MRNYRRLSWLGALTGLAAVVMLVARPTPGAGQNDSKLTIMASSSMQGDIVPCG